MARDAVVHVIDDDDGVRQSLAFLLTTSGFAVRVYESATAFMDAIPALQPGCILTDIRMHGVNGLELQRQLKVLKVGLPVIVMTGHADVTLAVEAMKAGAVDFIEKPFDDQTLVAAIKIAIDRYMQKAPRDNEVAGILNRMRNLSPRELEVLEGLLNGHPNKTIAYNLKISARTVEVHRANLMTKMDAGNLSDLFRMVFMARSAEES